MNKLKTYFKDTWHIAFVALAFIIFVATIVLSINSGNSGDEDGFQLPYAEQVVDFYATCGKDKTCLENDDLGMHGGWFDPLTVALIRLFNIDNANVFRHLLNSLIGFLGMLFAALLAKRVGGWRAAVITLVLIFLSPRFLGHSFNNPKDIPFATFFIASIYYIFVFISEYPKPTIKTSLKLAITMGLAILARIGGFLLYAYFGLFILLYYLFTLNRKVYFRKDNLKNLFKTYVYFIGICIAAFLLIIPFWPYIMSSPVATMVKAFNELSQYSVSIRQVFEGTIQWSNALPWYYTPKYILITIPIAVIIGFLIYPFVGGWRKENRLSTLILYFTCIFPVFWIIYTNANVYGGWRHALFAYPSMVVCAGLGFNSLINLCKNKYLKAGTAALPLLLLIMPLSHIIRNHPYEYVYFNELVGGLKKSYGNYEMDYYYHSTREASEWVVENAEKSGLETSDKIKVSTWHASSVQYFFRKDTAKFEVTFSRWYERSNNDWDYGIYTVTGISPERIKGAHFPPTNTIHTIDVDGKPIAIILKRLDKSDYYGNIQMKEGNLDSAITLFNKALDVDPYNEVVLSNMANIYLQKNQLDSSLIYLNRFLEIDPNRESEKYLQAYVYYYKSDFEKALSVCKELTDYNKSFGNAYSLAAEIYLRNNDMYSAEKEYQKLINVGMLDQNAFNQLMRIYAAQGLDQRAAQRKIFKSLADSYKKLGNKEAAKMYEEQLSRM